MASLDDVADTVDNGKEKLAEATAVIGAANAQADEVVDQLGSLGAEGRASAVSEIADKVEEVQSVLNGLGDKLDEIRTAIEAAKAGLQRGDSTGPAPPVSVPPRPPFKPMRTDPARRDEIAPHVGKPVAYATLWDSQGRKVVGVHSADDDGPAKHAQWKQPWGSYHRLRRHVEGHAAAQIKPGDTMAMYINMAPCKYPDGCERNLESILPEGSTLWVHWVKPDGMVRVLRYRGNGKASK